MLARANAPSTDAGTVEVVSRLYRVVAFIERRLTGVYGELGLKHGEVDVLNALLSGGKESDSPTNVAAALMCSTGAMTNRLDRLEKAGYLRREHGTEDRRSILLSITPEGKKLTKRANVAREAISGELLPALSTTERKAMVGMLRRMLTDFEATAGEDE